VMRARNQNEKMPQKASIKAEMPSQRKRSDAAKHIIAAKHKEAVKHTDSAFARRAATHRRRLNAAAGGSVVGGAFFGGSIAGLPGALVGGLVGYGVAALAAKETTA